MVLTCRSVPPAKRTGTIGPYFIGASTRKHRAADRADTARADLGFKRSCRRIGHVFNGQNVRGARSGGMLSRPLPPGHCRDLHASPARIITTTGLTPLDTRHQRRPRAFSP